MYNISEHARARPARRGGFGYLKSKGTFGLKKFFSALCAAALTAAVFAPAALAYQGPSVSCEAYIVMDADTGQVIGKLSREPVPYAGVSEQPDVPVSTGVIENPDAPETGRGIR